MYITLVLFLTNHDNISVLSFCHEDQCKIYETCCWVWCHCEGAATLGVKRVHISEGKLTPTSQRLHLICISQSVTQVITCFLAQFVPFTQLKTGGKLRNLQDTVLLQIMI